jgi:sulfatase maturation enzyme AslB (radical SAM superfamily)
VARDLKVTFQLIRVRSIRYRRGRVFHHILSAHADTKTIAARNAFSQGKNNMTYVAVSAFLDSCRIPPSGFVVTAVLKGGCPFNCPFCIVNKRDERREKSYLTTNHLISLLDAVARRGLLGGGAIVGDEPLQSHCWPIAKAFLNHAADKKLPTALISNGYNLIDFIDELRTLSTTKITISLDAASEKHDEIRRKPGAFARIAEGIGQAVIDPCLRERMSIATILMPGNLASISEIIAFTAANKIPQLLLSPLLTSSRTEPLTVHPKVMKEAWRAIPELMKEATAAGVKLRLSDEFAILGPWEEKVASTGIEIMAPKEPAKLIRVDAAGRVETLTTMHLGTTTGLQLPENVDEIDGFVPSLIEGCFQPVCAAA